MNYISEPVLGIKKEENMDPGVNQKYVKLLHNSFKKFEDVTRNEPLADNGNDNVEMKTRLQSECHSCKKVEVTELLQKAIEKYQTRDK